MVHSQYFSITKDKITKLNLLAIALGLVIGVVLAALPASAFPATASTFEFTQAELDNNWQADRAFPTDGATSVSAFGRNNVARLGVDSNETAADTFQRTEGIKTVGAGNFGNAVQVDLYVDPDWAGKAVRAGAWVVGDNGAGARDNWFGILEFVNLEPSTSGASAQGNHEGWRIWDSSIGWINVNTAFEYGKWYTLTIELDTFAGIYNYYVNDALVGSAGGGTDFIREVFLNSYNYGLDTFPNLSNTSYAAHWNGGALQKLDCKDGNWESLGFKNQGQCVQYVNTGKDSREP